MDSGANRDAGEQVEGGREASTWTGGGGAEDTGLGSDAESSGSEVGGGDLAGLAVEAGWGGCSVVSTLGATLESKLKDLSLIRRFAVQPGSRLHLPVKVSARSDWGFRGEDGLPPLGCRHTCHSPRAALSSPATVVATSGGVGTCER